MPTLAVDAAQTAQNSPTGRVLVVEDEEVIRETITLALSDEGYDVQSAADGSSALEMIGYLSRNEAGREDDSTGLDLIILDLMLPNINGLDLCRLLRHEGNQVPILILSAKGSETDRVVGLEVGADDYLAKPFGMRELIARCRALLRRSSHLQTASKKDSVTFQNIVLYPQECRVTVDGKEVNLSPKEFRLLDLFINHPRRVWSRDQLIDRVWGPDFMGDSKTVDVHIRWLREKLEVDPSHPEHIVTVRGFGYRFG